MWDNYTEDQGTVSGCKKEVVAKNEYLQNKLTRSDYWIDDVLDWMSMNSVTELVDCGRDAVLGWMSVD